MLISQLVLQKMSSPPKDPKGPRDPQTQMMSQMMLFMPIMFGYITLGLPSGLTLYWTVSNLLSIVQQYFVAGWGSLVEWFGFLRPQTAPAVPAVAKGKSEAPSSAAPASSGSTTGPSKPIVKRRRRRR
jgi:YidC/Oxa1 family membrane protein insertase